MLFQLGLANFQNTIQYLDSIGLTDVLLPFALIFSVLFALLQRLSVFTEKKGSETVPNTRINSIIALTISLMVVIIHVTGRVPPEQDPINILNKILPSSALITIIVLVVFILLALVMDPKKIFLGSSAIGSLVGFAAIIALGAVIVRATYPAFLPYEWFAWLDDPNTQAIIIMLAVFALIIWFVTSEPPTTKKSWPERLKDAGLAWSG